MKKVLILAYYFPPLGGPGVQRTLGYVKYLKEFGWEPVILTVDESTRFDIKDESLLKEIPEVIKIERTHHKYLPWGIRAALHKIPDEFIGWLPSTYFKALEIMKKNDYDVIYTTGPPQTAHLIGYLLKKKTGKPLIVDFRDEWTQNPFNKYSFFYIGVNQWLEKKVLQNADAVVSVSEGITKGLRTLINDKNNKFHTITNGYDESDFNNYKPKDTYGDKFRITYTGSFYGGYPSGSRYPYTFFKIIGDLLKENRINKDDLKIIKIGQEEKLDPTIPEENIDYVGYVPHNEVFKYVKNTTILLLVVQTKNRMELAYTGKIFEYINSEKPILALVPKDGVAVDLIRKTNTGVVVEPDDVDGIKKAILDSYNKWKNNDLKIEPNWNVIKQYERKNLTKKLAQIFDELINES